MDMAAGIRYQPLGYTEGITITRGLGYEVYTIQHWQEMKMARRSMLYFLEQKVISHIPGTSIVQIKWAFQNGVSDPHLNRSNNLKDLELT